MPDARLREVGSGSAASASQGNRADFSLEQTETEQQQQQRLSAKLGDAAAAEQKEQQQQLPRRQSIPQPVINTAPSPAESPSLASSSSTPASTSSGVSSLSFTQSVSSLAAARRPSQPSPRSLSSKAQDLLFGGQKHNAEHNKLCDMLGLTTKEYHNVEQQMERQRRSSLSSSQQLQQQEDSKRQQAPAAADDEVQPSPVSSRRQSVVVAQSKAMDLLHGGHKADGHKVSDRLGISWHEMQRAHQQHRDSAALRQPQQDATSLPAAASSAAQHCLPANLSPTSAGGDGSPTASSASPPHCARARQQSISRKAADLLYGSVKSASKVEDRLGVREKEIDTFAQCQKAYQRMGVFDTTGDAKDGRAAVARERAARGAAEAAAARAGERGKARAATASLKQDWQESGTTAAAAAAPLSQSLRRKQSLSATATSLAPNISQSQVAVSPHSSQRCFRTPSNDNALLAAAAANAISGSPSQSRHRPLSRNSSTASIETLSPRAEPETPQPPSAAAGAAAAWRRKATLLPLGAPPRVPFSPTMRSSREAATAGSRAAQAAAGGPVASPAQQRSTERAHRLRSKVKMMGMVSAWQRRSTRGGATAAAGGGGRAAGSGDSAVPATPLSARARRPRSLTSAFSSSVVSPGPASVALQLGVSGRAISARPMRGLSVEEETEEEAAEDRTTDSLRSPLLTNRRTARVAALAPIRVTGRLTTTAAIH